MAVYNPKYRARNTKNKVNCIRLFEWVQGREFIVFDTETTGLKESDYIVELAAIKCRVMDCKIEEINRIDLFIKPPFLMDEKVVGIHGITNEELADKLTEEQSFEDIKAFFGTTPILVGYNVGFDSGMLSQVYKRNNAELTPVVEIDVLEMARDLVYGKEVDNYKLGEIAKMHGLDVGLKFHQGIDDVVATLRLLNYFYNEYKKQPPEPMKQKCVINYLYFWSGMRKEQSGLYVDTNLGRIYYSTFLKTWASSNVDLSFIDIDEFETNVVLRTQLNIKEIGKLTSKKFEELKEQRRAEGVRLW